MCFCNVPSCTSLIWFEMQSSQCNSRTLCQSVPLKMLIQRAFPSQRWSPLCCRVNTRNDWIILSLTSQLLCSVTCLEGPRVHGSVQREENTGGSEKSALTHLTPLTGFKDPPEVNTHMVGRLLLVLERGDETSFDSHSFSANAWLFFFSSVEIEISK